MSEYKLTNYEKETIITNNEAEATAECYTCSPVLMRKLDGLCAKSTEITVKKQDQYSKTYIFPKKWVGVRLPRIMSEKQREHLEEMQRRNRENDKK